MQPAVQRRLRAALGETALVAHDDGTWSVVGASVEPVRRTVEILAQERVRFAPVGRATTVTAAVKVSAPSGIFDLWTDELVVRVGAGTTLGELDAALAPHGLCCGLADATPASTSLGALFAAGDRGLRGGDALRERTLAVTLVDGTGTLRRSGARVVKNVAGFDLARLHWGARGSLGLLLDLTVRVRALPSARRVIAWTSAREDLRATMEHVRSIAHDHVSELWVSAAAAARAGLRARTMLVCAREGAPEGLERWAAAMGGDLLEEDAWLRLGAACFDPSLPSYRATGVTLRSCVERGIGEDENAPWVVDLLAGEAWWVGATPVGLAGATTWAETEPARRGRRTQADTVRAQAEARLRTVFDPHGLLPDPPAPLVLPAGSEVTR